MFHFYTPWKLQKTFGFLIFSRGIEVEHWLKMGLLSQMSSKTFFAVINMHKSYEENFWGIDFWEISQN